MRICHITSVHPPEDVRIFFKECISLVSAGHEVFLVEKGKSYKKNGVHIIGLGDTNYGKIRRILITANRAYREALMLNCDVYHIHDPELIPYGIKLKKRGKIVIFDSHEDVPEQILNKTWIPRAFRRAVSEMYRRYEHHAVSQFDAVVAAVPSIAKKIKKEAKRVVVINNYPRLDEIKCGNTPFDMRKPIVCYAGGINENRGEKIMISAIKNISAKLFLAGDHKKESIDDKIVYMGRLDRNEINELYGKSVVGLCMLKPLSNYLHSRPIKMYEYMAAGIPFVCSDFPFWKKLVGESQAGICVSPHNIDDVSNAILEILSNREKAQMMGKNGRAYVEKYCSWENEEKKLLDLYDSLQIS